MTSLEDLGTYLKVAAPGDQIVVDVLRAGKKHEFIVTAEKSPDGRTVMGIYVYIGYKAPMKIDINLANVGGPSAGLSFALSIVDQLTPGDLLRGRDIAVTRTIDSEGVGGPIGGLPQKLAAAARAGATMILIPLANCADVPKNPPAELRIVPVKTLKAAIAALESTGSAAKLATCPAASPAA